MMVRLAKRVALALSVCALCTYYISRTTVRVHYKNDSSLLQKIANVMQLSSSWMNHFTPYSFRVPVLIVDPKILHAISASTVAIAETNSKLLVAVEKRFYGRAISANDDRLDILYYSKNHSRRDYWLFESTSGDRAMQPFETISSDLVTIPLDISSFLDDWSHSRLIKCRNLTNRNSTVQRIIPLSFVDHLAELRNFLKIRKARALLAGGTLLGWYRECSLITHTKDVDFFIPIDNYSASLLADLDSRDSPYTVSRIYGTPSDSLELTVKVKATPVVSIDLFFVYTNSNESYVGGLEWNRRKKYKWTYPRMTSFCTADLLSHLFNVPCNVKELLETEYGNWQQETRTDRFKWNKSHRNVQQNGVWTAEEMQKMRPAGWRWAQDLKGFLIRQFT